MSKEFNTIEVIYLPMPSDSLSQHFGAASLDQFLPTNINYYEGKTNESSGIMLELTSAVSDISKTLLQIRVTGILSGRGFPDISPIDIFLIGESGHDYLAVAVGGGTYYENTTYDIEDLCLIEFVGGLTTESNMTLTIKKINGIEGNWTVEFVLLPYAEIIHFESDTNYVFENGTDLTVTDVTCCLTDIRIEGRYNIFIGNEQSTDRPSVLWNTILYIDGVEHKSIQQGVSEFNTFNATFEPQRLSVDSVVELEIQLDRIIGTDNLYHPDPNNIIRKQLYLIPDVINSA